MLEDACTQGAPRLRTSGPCSADLPGCNRENGPQPTSNEEIDELRRGLRAKARQLGDAATSSNCSSPNARTSNGTDYCSPVSSARTTCSSTPSTEHQSRSMTVKSSRGPSKSRTAGLSLPVSPLRSCPASSASMTPASGCASRPKAGYL